MGRDAPRRTCFDVLAPTATVATTATELALATMLRPPLLTLPPQPLLSRSSSDAVASMSIAPTVHIRSSQWRGRGRSKRNRREGCAYIHLLHHSKKGTGVVRKIVLMHQDSKEESAFDWYENVSLGFLSVVRDVICNVHVDMAQCIQ